MISPEGTIDLVFDDVALTYTGARVTVIVGFQIFGSINGVPFTSTQVPGTRTVTFATPIPVVTAVGHHSRSIQMAGIAFALGARKT